MPNDWPTHEDIEICIQRAHRGRSVCLAGLIVRGIDATGSLIKKPVAMIAIALTALIGGVFVQADTSSTVRGAFAAACAEREAALIITAQTRDDGDATAALAKAEPKLMIARSDCHEGRVKEAVAVYDELIRQVAAIAQSRETDAAE